MLHLFSGIPSLEITFPSGVPPSVPGIYPSCPEVAPHPSPDLGTLNPSRTSVWRRLATAGSVTVGGWARAIPGAPQTVPCEGSLGN